VNRSRGTKADRGAVDRLVAQLERIEAAGGDGRLELTGGGALDVTNLDKVFFPRPRRTKGDLLRYYARVAPVLLPAIADRPLVLRRFPNGITSPAFYQQKAPDRVPEGVRVESLTDADGEVERRFVGGDLSTLFYTVQLGAISVDPWHGRLGTLDEADYSIIDLDPGPRASFRHVVEVARWVREELDSLGLRAALKTSGATGLHIALPLSPGTPHEAARLVAELVATRVAQRHPRRATVVRAVRARPESAVYVDYLQNIPGKTVAGVYSARARPGATVSTPLEWDELNDDLDARAFTIDTVPERIARVGDVWALAMSRPNRLESLVSPGAPSPAGTPAD
jgi:bifunctional non-homologous end joining protein LigD